MATHSHVIFSAILVNYAYLSQKTNMEVSNLSLVFAPNIIRSPSNDPSIFAANADAEKRCFELFVAASVA